MAWQKVRIKIPEGFDAEERQEIGAAMIDMIRDRCAQGEGVRPAGKSFKTYSFPDYSKSYADFKGSTNVDLVLTSEMLTEIQVLSTKNDSVLIGFQNGSKANAKAEGNQLGSYGGTPRPKKARRFLGITDDELDAILAGFED